MKLQHLLRNSALVAVFVAFALAAASPAHASTIVWTDWTSATGTVAPGTATGTMGGITVTYTGQFDQVNGAPTWVPSSSFVGGVVGNEPPQGYDAIQYTLASGAETISFSSPVTNPVMAFWSLGENLRNVACTGDTLPGGCVPVVYEFTNLQSVTEGAPGSFILEAGGTDNNQFGSIVSGASIQACTGTTTTTMSDPQDGSLNATIGTGCSSKPGSTGNVVFGYEGSGTIELIGTFGNGTGIGDNGYAPITFTTPDTEFVNSVTVGEQTPEPETLSLLGLGLLALPLIRASLARRRRA